MTASQTIQNKLSRLYSIISEIMETHLSNQEKGNFFELPVVTVYVF